MLAIVPQLAQNNDAHNKSTDNNRALYGEKKVFVQCKALFKLGYVEFMMNTVIAMKPW